jgi:hypothetical protein
MTVVDDVRIRLAVFAWTIAFGGCAIGTAYVSAPDRLPSKALPPLTQPLKFDVCVPDSGPRRQALGKRIETALSHAGVRADLSDGGSPVDFTVVYWKDDLSPTWSAVVSIMSLSVVPGYFVELKKLDVNLAWRDAAQAEQTEHLQYQSRMYVFIWLPLIVTADLLWVGGDGWESRKMEDGGFRQMVARLGDDIRARLGNEGVEPPVRRGEGVVCP